MLHLRNSSGYYGAERCIVSWMRELQPRGFAFDLAAYMHPDPSTRVFLDDARAAGATVHELPRDHSQMLTAVGRLFRIVTRRRIELIHAHENRSHVVGWLMGGLTATPVVGSVHGYVPVHSRARLMDSVNRSFLRGRRLKALTAPSEELARQLGGHVQVVPNAISAQLAVGPRASDSPPDTPTFGMVARLSAEKGVRVFLDAIATIEEPWSFVVVGDGPDRDALRRHPAADRVRWEGFRQDASSLMRNWTALVIPSFTEGIPLTLLEAMAQGVPLIASRVGGIPETLDHEHEGMLVDPGDSDALVRAMRAVVGDPDGSRARSHSARDRFLRNHTLERAGDLLEKIYRDAARSRS